MVGIEDRGVPHADCQALLELHRLVGRAIGADPVVQPPAPHWQGPRRLVERHELEARNAEPEQAVHFVGAAQLPVEMRVARQQPLALVLGNVSTHHSHVKTPVGLQPLRFQADRKNRRGAAHEIPLLELERHHPADHRLDLFLDRAENPREIVVVVDGELSERPLRLKDGQLAGDAADFGVGLSRMNSLREGDHTHHGLGFQQLRQHHQPVEVAGFGTREANAPVDGLLGQHLHLAADEVVDAADDVETERLPGIDRQHRREKVGVDLGGGLAIGGAANLRDRQQFEARQILGGELERDIQPAELDLLVVAAGSVVLQRLSHDPRPAVIGRSGR